MTSDQTEVQGTPCVSRPNLQGLVFDSSAQWNDQRSLGTGDGLIRSHFRVGWSDQRRIQAHNSLIREDYECNCV